MSLPHLPNELQDLIVTKLHPTAVIALSQTNRHYHSTVSLHRLAPDTVRVFLKDLQERSDNITMPEAISHERYACYKCLCLKPAMSFSYPEHKYSETQCLECDLQDGRAKPGGIYFSCYHDPSIICVECLKAQGVFCRGCDACASCLEKKGVEFCVDCGWCYACVALRSLEWMGLEIGLACKVGGKLCRGCGACALCLQRKGVEFCADCGWCDPCVGHKLVEWERAKKKSDDQDDDPGFFYMLKACLHHILEYGEILESQRLKYENEEGSEEGLDKREDEHEERGDDDENGKKEERISKAEPGKCSIGQTENRRVVEEGEDVVEVQHKQVRTPQELAHDDSPHADSGDFFEH